MQTNNKIVSFRTLIIISVILFVFQTKTNAQEGAYWTGLSTVNPAVIGTPSDWIVGVAEFGDIPNYDETISSFSLISDYRISPKAGSLGANFIYTSVGNETAYVAEFLYAYTLTLKKNRQLNFGASFGVEGVKSDYGELDNTNLKASYLKTNFGFLYHSRKLDIGLSYASFDESKNEYSSYRLIDNYTSFVTAYRFYIKEKFVIEPNIRMDFYGEGDNDGYLGIHLEYDNFVWLGSSSGGSSSDVSSIYAGVDVSNQFRIALQYSFSDYYQYGQARYYQLTLGYRLN